MRCDADRPGSGRGFRTSTSFLAEVAVITFIGGIAAIGIGCGDGRAVDPDGRTKERPRSRLAGARGAAEGEVDVRLRGVVAAAAGVPASEAARVLGRWLAESGPEAAALLAGWPRAADGSLDLDRSPLVPVAVDGAIVPLARGGASSCGEVAATFRGLGPTAIRVRMPVPGTSRTCRSAHVAKRIHDDDAIDALREAMGAGRVPEDVGPGATVNPVPRGG